MERIFSDGKKPMAGKVCDGILNLIKKSNGGWMDGGWVV